MKVYIINSVYKYGSTGNICAELKERLELNGAACRVAYGRKSERNTINDGYLIANRMQFLLHVLYTRITDRHGLFSKKATKRLINDIINFRPDIIHLHNIHGYYLDYKVLFEFLKTYHKPIVWTLHDCWAFTGHCAYFDAANCEKWKVHCEKCDLSRNYPQSWGVDKSYQNFDAKRKSYTNLDKMYVVTPSKWMEKIVKKSFLGEYPVQTIYNGIDVKKFCPRDGRIFRERIGATHKKIILGVASVWTVRKGLDDFIRLQNFLDENYQIVLVGVNEKQRQAIPKSIYCIARTESVEKLAEIYSAADIYFNASIEETMGLTTVEALACGTPVVVYNKTAIPEMVPEGGGVVLEPGDIRKVKEAIDELVKEPKKDYSSMVQWLEKSKQYGKYMELYDRIYQNS